MFSPSSGSFDKQGQVPSQIPAEPLTSSTYLGGTTRTDQPNYSLTVNPAEPNQRINRPDFISPSITSGIKPGDNKTSWRTFKKSIPVASYKDPYYKYYRRALRAILVFILPGLVVIFIAILLFGYITENFKEQPTPRETYVLTDIPVPPDAVTASFDPASTALSVGVIENSWVSNYHPETSSSAAYLIDLPQNQPMEWLKSYYSQKLRASQWQLSKGVTYTGNIEVYPTVTGQPITLKSAVVQEQQLYVQGVKGATDKQLITGLFIDYRLVTETNLKRDATMYGPKAKAGEIYVVLTKNYLRRNF